jgi:hypothetical protein
MKDLFLRPIVDPVFDIIDSSRWHLIHSLPRMAAKQPLIDILVGIEYQQSITDIIFCMSPK